MVPSVMMIITSDWACAAWTFGAACSDMTVGSAAFATLGAKNIAHIAIAINEKILFIIVVFFSLIIKSGAILRNITLLLKYIMLNKCNSVYLYCKYGLYV